MPTEVLFKTTFWILAFKQLNYLFYHFVNFKFGAQVEMS